MTATATRSRKTSSRKPSAAQPTQREIEWQKLLDEALETPGNVGDTYRRFYDYSFLNCLYLQLQGARGPVATYNRWQELGRQVRRGEKAKRIIRPITITRQDDPADPESVRSFLRFKEVAAIFDVDQTDGADLPPFVHPTWDLDAALTALEITRIPFECIDGNTQGYSTERQFALNPVAVNPQKTTLHEVAHIVLGHTTDGAHADYVAHRGHKEFAAEATAFLAMRELGLLDDDAASESRGYIQHWLREERPTDAEVRQVFHAVDTILRAGRPATPTTNDEEVAS
jgi:antirestriction protein ArdC